MKTYDVAIIGGGPGGYIAAIRAASDGMKTVLIEQDFLGGTCLNRGCIPSKTFLKYAEVIETIKKSDSFGVELFGYSISLDKMKQQKDSILTELRNGIRYLLDKGKIDVVKGIGKIKDTKKIAINNEESEIVAEKIIIATGSSPAIPPIKGLETISYETSDTIFDMEKLPKTLTIIGGGVIGVEIATIFSGLGVNVNVVEFSDRLIPSEDPEASHVLLKTLQTKDVNVLLEHSVVQVSNSGTEIAVNLDKKNGENKVLKSEKVLICTGRKANLSAVEFLDLAMDKGFIKVDDYLQTSIKNIFAIGDVIGNYQLAHVASFEGLTAVSNLLELKNKISYDLVPRCVYTMPQIASIGHSESMLQNMNIKYSVQYSSHSVNGKALTNGDRIGFTKLFVDTQYGEILGAVLVGQNVTEMLGQMTSYMHLEGTIDELATMIQPHPTLSETFFEVANQAIGKTLHG